MTDKSPGKEGFKGLAREKRPDSGATQRNKNKLKICRTRYMMKEKIYAEAYNSVANRFKDRFISINGQSMFIYTSNIHL